MKLFNRIFWSALMAGGVAGLVLAGIQHYTVVPMILKAETYETASTDQGHHGHVDHGHHHGDTAWAPEDGAERTFYTAINSVIAGIGFGLLLTACYALRRSVSVRTGIFWGLAGFAVFSLAPALGLPPELPGDVTAGLGERQAWWSFTVIATALGLWMIILQPVNYLKIIGIAIIILPHLTGAPQPEVHGGLAPAELRDAFIYTSLITNAIFWMILGVTSAYFFTRSAETSTANPGGLTTGGGTGFTKP